MTISRNASLRLLFGLGKQIYANGKKNNIANNITLTFRDMTNIMSYLYSNIISHLINNKHTSN